VEEVNGNVEEVEDSVEEVNGNVEKVEDSVEEVEDSVGEVNMEEVNVEEVNGDVEEIEGKISEDKDGFMKEIDNMLEDNTKMVQIGETVNKSVKSTPNSLAKDFDVEHVEISENNGKKYEVVVNKNGIKRWKKVN